MSILALVALSACGGGGAPTIVAPIATLDTTATVAPPAATQGAGATTDPGGGTSSTCSLFTQAELKTATGLDWGVGMDDGYGSCTWHVGTATVNDGKGQIVAAYVDQPISALKTAFPGGADFNIQGTAGYWNPNQGIQTFWIDRGARTLAISLDPKKAEYLAVALKLVDIVLPKL